MTSKPDISADSVVSTDELLITNEVTTVNKYSVYLGEDIKEANKYYPLFNLLRTAEDYDSFIFYVNNYGGQVNTMVELVHALKATKADTYGVISGPIYSAAPLVTLAFKKIHVHDNVFMMFHDYSGAEVGKGNEVEKSIKAYRQFWSVLFNDIVKGFLKKEEVTDILEGKDLYLNSKQIKARLRRLKKLETKIIC